MAKFVMPSAEELAKEYGKWETSSVLREVANWGLPNASKDFVEADNLEFLEEQNNHFEVLSKKFFEPE